MYLIVARGRTWGRAEKNEMENEMEVEIRKCEAGATDWKERKKEIRLHSFALLGRTFGCKGRRRYAKIKD